jgi:hypothetical protein
MAAIAVPDPSPTAPSHVPPQPAVPTTIRPRVRRLVVFTGRIA